MTALCVVLLLGSLAISAASANANSNFSSLNFSGSGVQQFSLKKDLAYEEPKDPALRTGTENWEQPQWSFFVVPGVFISLALLVLFFNRKK